MTLEQIVAGVSGQDLGSAVRELQDLHIDVVAGAAAETNIALAAITTVDTIKAAILVKDPSTATSASIVKLTPSANGAGGGIPINGQIRFVEATNATAGDRILVFWHEKPANLT